MTQTSRLAATILAAVSAHAAFGGQMLFESAELGETGVVPSPETPAANVNAFSFNGVRFSLTSPAMTNEIGGHFVGDGTLFGAIVELNGSDDFPISADLSTSDVLGTTLITLSDPSEESVGGLDLLLQPGNYALVFGGGLFDAQGSGGALLNNSDLGSGDNIGFMQGFGWGERRGGFRFFVSGVSIPEPSASAAVFLCVFTTFFVSRNDRRPQNS